MRKELKKVNRFDKNKKGLSPIISTVLLIVIAVALFVANIFLGKKHAKRGYYKIRLWN